MTEKTQKVLDKCLQITGSFEGAGWGGVTGNFDGQGLSAFIMQWNLGQRTLQPLLIKMEESNPELFRKCFSNVELVRLMAAVRSGNRDMEQEFVNHVTTGREESHPGRPFPTGYRYVKGEWREAFQAVGTLFKEHQREAAMSYFNAAMDWCLKFEMRSERAVAFMFDQCIQRGKHSLNDEYRDYLNDFNAITRMTDHIKMRIILEDDLPDFSERWREDVKSRRLCIIEGRGRVHNRDRDLEADYGLSDEVVL